MRPPTAKHWRQFLPDWHKASLVVAYFLLIGVISMFAAAEWPFRILLWPVYVFPEHPFIAAVLELLFIYAVAAAVDVMVLRRKKR